MGLGYVGAVTAACLAHLGHRVLGVDVHALKVDSVLAGQAPFYEPGLEQLIRENVAAGRLSASTSLAGRLADAEVVLICVGTPSERSGDLGPQQLRRASEEIGRELREAGRPATEPLAVAVRSTVFPGTCEAVVGPALAGSRARVVSNPEFLREGSAVEDFLRPSLLVVGGADAEACQRVAGLYAPLGVPPCLVSLRTAEMIKYACNSFHALKIVFANEMGALCAELGVSGREIMATLCEDVKLNISPAYLKPGFVFGGSCLPKDLRALVYRASRLDLKLPLLESVLPSNQEHLRRAIQSILDLPAERIGIFGLAFKENTDDLRESPVVELIEHLLGKGRHLRIFDPHIRLEALYGSNREFLLSTIPHISRWLDPTLDHLLGWAEHLVLAQRPAPELAHRIRQSGLPVLDLVQSL
jgi:GDP-mannose 6-dehydrogenase